VHWGRGPMDAALDEVQCKSNNCHQTWLFKEGSVSSTSVASSTSQYLGGQQYVTVPRSSELSCNLIKFDLLAIVDLDAEAPSECHAWSQECAYL
jgi:hypothetical protein